MSGWGRQWPVNPAAVPATIVVRSAGLFLGDAATQPVLVEISPSSRTDAAPAPFGSAACAIRWWRRASSRSSTICRSRSICAKWGAGDLDHAASGPARDPWRPGAGSGGSRYTVGAETLQLDLDVGRVNPPRPDGQQGSGSRFSASETSGISLTRRFRTVERTWIDGERRGRRERRPWSPIPDGERRNSHGVLSSTHLAHARPVEGYPGGKKVLDNIHLSSRTPRSACSASTRASRPS